MNCSIQINTRYCKKLQEEKPGYEMQLSWEVSMEEEWGQTAMCSNTTQEGPKNVPLIYVLKNRRILLQG